MRWWYQELQFFYRGDANRFSMTFVSKIYIILLLITALNRDVCNDSSLVLTIVICFHNILYPLIFWKIIYSRLMNETYARGSFTFISSKFHHWTLTYTHSRSVWSVMKDIAFGDDFFFSFQGKSSTVSEIYLGKRTKFSDFLSVSAPSSQSLSPTSLISLATSHSRASVTHFWLNFFFFDVFHLPSVGSTIHPKPWSVPRSWIGREEGSDTASRTLSSITRRKYVVMVVVNVGDLTNVLSTCIS